MALKHILVVRYIKSKKLWRAQIGDDVSIYEEAFANTKEKALRKITLSLAKRYDRQLDKVDSVRQAFRNLDL